MTGKEMLALRKRTGMNDVTFGIALGYNGSSNTIYQTIRRYERGERDIPEWIAVAARALDTQGIWNAAAKTGCPISVGAIAAAQKYITKGEVG